MSPERYAALRILYEAVADLPLSLRAAGLRAQCSDEPLIAEVLALFAAGESSTTGALDRPLRNTLRDAMQAPSAGDVIGVWKVQAAIGQGGMGMVFRVDRCDGHFVQSAALKLLRGLPDQTRLAQLARERQLLASLTHPNIARLYDGGTTASGQPYLVMELVEGQPIDQYCQSKQLDLRAVLALFEHACQAVAFAHRQLIVHCDIKPSNLLINREGRPVLLDFGIARLSDTETDSNANGAGSGAPAVLAFTPRYASPEQRTSSTVSTLSDIYSLGVLLAELLGALTRRHHELAAIIEKATHGEASLRYASVDALIEDLQRYRLQKPLRALPASRWYIGKKFIARHRLGVLLSLLFVLALGIFTARIAIERDVAEAERDRAMAAEASTKRISNFLASILTSVDPDNARSMDRTLMLSVLAQAADKAALELAQQPRELREISTVIADSYMAITDFESAAHHYQLARQQWGASASSPTANDEAVLVAHLELQQKHALALIALNRLDESEPMVEAGLASASNTLGAQHPMVLVYRTLQVKQHFAAGKRRQALALAEQTYQQWQPLLAQAQSLAVRHAAIWFELLNQAAVVNSDLDQFERAHDLLQEAIALVDARYGAASSQSLRAHHSLAVLFLQSKRYSEAFTVLEPLARDAEQHLGANHLFTISALSNLGMALRFGGEHERAGPYYREAHRRALATFGAADSLTLMLTNNLALFELANQQPEQALKRIESLVPVVEATHDRLHPLLVEVLRTRAKALAANQRWSAARAIWQEVIARDLEIYGARDAQTLEDQAALAKLMR